MSNVVNINDWREESVVGVFLDRYKGSPNTLLNYKHDIKSFFNVEIDNVEFISNDTLRNISVKDVLDYIDNLFNEGKSLSTIKRRLSSVGNLIEEAIDEDVVEKNVFNDRRIKKLVNARKEKDKKVGIALNKDEIKELINRIDESNSIMKERDKLLITTMLGTGMRVSEVIKMNKNDFFEKDGKWYLEVFGKGRKWRYVNVKKELVDRFEDYEDEPFKMMPRNVDYRIKKYDDKLSCHDLRRTYITLLLKEGVLLRDVQKQVGHECDSTTNRYYIENERFSNVSEYVDW